MTSASSASADPGAAWADGLEPGQVCRLFLLERWMNAQLVWRSDNHSMFVFSSRHGGRTHSLTRRSLDKLRAAGVPLMTAPSATYYEMLSERLPGHGETVSDLQTRGILLDGSTKGGDKRLLLQIFSETLLGPVFFEFIQRKSDEGFGEGNFKALFESLERDQVRRGVIKTEA